jgi:transcriptional regulator with XRE-family HTH domain
LDEKKTIRVGKVLEKYRRAKLLSQEELAFRCGKSTTYISDLERDIYSPGLKNFIEIAYKLEVNPVELLSEILDESE